MGRVWSISSQKYLKGGSNGKYLKVHLVAKNGKIKQELVHRLVALAFLDNPQGFPQVNHKDKNKLNNCVDNLEWCTNRYNTIHAIGKAIYCVELDKEFDCIQTAATELNLDRGNISRCCSGKRKTCGGYHWRYCDVAN